MTEPIKMPVRSMWVQGNVYQMGVRAWRFHSPQQGVTNQWFWHWWYRDELGRNIFWQSSIL